MATEAMAMFGLFAALTELTGRKPAAVVPEPEFVRFRLPEREAAGIRAGELPAANDPAAEDLAA